MRLVRTARLTGLVGALLLVLVACGGDDTDAGGTTAEGDTAEETTAASTEAMTEESTESTEAAAAGDVQAAMVTDVGGLGDNSFNDSAFAGLQQAESDLGATIEVLESSAPTDYVTNLTQLAENGFSPVFAVGFLMTDAVAQVAPQFPDTQFAIIDSVVEEPNVASLVFEEQQGSYLAGIVAGLMTSQDTEFTTPDDTTVGFLGGQESPLIQKFQAGYEAGVQSVCPDCEVLVDYAGTTPDAFNDPARGQEIALSQNDGGADIIFHASGATGNGLFEAATDRGFFAIGVDSNQAELVPDAPILTSMLKRVDNAVFQTTEAAANDEFPGGEVQTFGIEDDGVGLAPYGEYEDLVPTEVTDAVDAAREEIASGATEVPTEPSS